MLIVISPAKKLDYDTPAPTGDFTLPELLEQSQQLIDILKGYSVEQIAELMKLSDKLAQLNYERYQAWTRKITPDNAKQALFAFKGDVYAGLNADQFEPDDIAFAQDHLRILSGLYGVLRPLDLMLPYRLEMGTPLPNPRGKNLYDFWGDIITEKLNEALAAQGDDVLINLASNEYFNAVRPKKLKGRIVTPQFKERREDGSFKMIGIYAKKARGLMSRYIVTEQLSDPEQLKAFDYAGYAYNPDLSKGDTWVFTR